MARWRSDICGKVDGIPVWFVTTELSQYLKWKTKNKNTYYSALCDAIPLLFNATLLMMMLKMLLHRLMWLLLLLWPLIVSKRRNECGSHSHKLTKFARSSLHIWTPSNLIVLILEDIHIYIYRKWSISIYVVCCAWVLKRFVCMYI